MIVYSYSREIVDGVYNIDNQYKVDSEGNIIRLATIIKDNLPNKNFKVCCHASVCKVVFENPLSSEEISLLDTLVYNYKYLP